MTRIKICGVTSPEIAALACEAGADAIGLVFYPPSVRAVELAVAREIVQAVAPLVTTVGLFVDAEAADVNRVLDACPLDCLQFHGRESAGFCTQFARPYIRAVSMRPGVHVALALAAHPDARSFLFDAWREDAPGGTGETFAWERLPVLNVPWILAGGLHAGNVGTAIQQLAPPAVDVSGGVESAPGIKDPARIQRFIAAVRAADEQRSLSNEHMRKARHDQ